MGQIIVCPSLIIEVLSESTEAFDRGDKFADYRELETLQEYSLISQSRQRVDCFRRNESGQWVLFSYGESEDLFLETIQFTCPVKVLYEDVELSNV